MAQSRFLSTHILVLVSVLLGAACAEARQAGRRGGGITREEYSSKLGQALDDIEKRADARRGKEQLEIHTNLFLAHEALIAGTPASTLKKAVDAFAEAGVSQVDLNMGLFPWRDHDEETIEKYDEVVAHIRGKGMRVGINPQYSPLYHQVRGLDEWREAALPVYEEIASRYSPDVFVVVHEPSTMAARMGLRDSRPEDWVAFAREATKVVKGASAKSRIGAGGLATEEEFFDAFAKMKEIDVLTLDVYALRALPTYGKMIRTAHREGKGVYMEETWRPPYFKLELGMSADDIAVRGVGDRYFEPLDVKWMLTMAAWAQAMGLEAITPVWMQTFFAYGGKDTKAFDPDYLEAVMTAIDRGERTETYEALKDLGRQAGR